MGNRGWVKSKTVGRYLVWNDPPCNSVVVPFMHLCDQTGMSVANVWDGVEVKLTFRRTFSEEMMERWNELTEIISSVRFNEDSDTLVWQYESKGEYSTQSLYAVINFKGVVPIYIPAVWKLKVPPKVQVFL
jgi:hypothetical protein